MLSFIHWAKSRQPGIPFRSLRVDGRGSKCLDHLLLLQQVELEGGLELAPFRDAGAAGRA